MSYVSVCVEISSSYQSIYDHYISHTGFSYCVKLYIFITGIDFQRVGEREREREREREAEREGDRAREAETETDRQTDRQTER